MRYPSTGSLSTGSRGRRRAAHKAEHTVDLETQVLVVIQVCGADKGDTVSLPRSLLQASDKQQTTEGAFSYIFL